jgi:hypothetical protein
MNHFSDTGLGFIQSGGPHLEYMIISDIPTKNSWGLRNQKILATSLKHETVRLDNAGTFHTTSPYSFVWYVRPSCWNHTAACVFPTKLPCMVYIPMALKTSPCFTLLYTTQHKNASLLCWTMYFKTLY